MDGLNKFRLALTFWFLLWAILSIDNVIANDNVSQNALAVNVEEQKPGSSGASKQNGNPQNNTVNSQAARKTDATVTHTLADQFPQLQRALIILTIVNFVAIIFASLMYLVKRRMQQFTPAPIAKLKQES
jgi:hypothetical protein